MIAGIPSARIWGSRGTSAGPRRTGVVHGNGLRSFGDDTGWFHPFGTTLFWALIGTRDEPDHWWRNVEFARAGGVDFVRWLAACIWPDRHIDPNWPDYDDVFIATIDGLYDRGVRSMITLIGGDLSDVGSDPVGWARARARMIRGREEKVFLVEMANEWDLRRGLSLGVMQDMARAVRQELPNTLIAMGRGDWDNVDRLMLPGDKRCVALGHLDRTEGAVTNGMSWREVRQSWDWRDLPYLSQHNEPKGPQSSIASQPNAIVLAAMRAVGIICGMDSYVLHFGAGVFGVPNRGRPSDLWDVENAAGIFAAVKAAGDAMPIGTPDWQKYNGHWQGHPFPACHVWEDGFDHGIVRTYAAVSGGRFVTVPFGIKEYYEAIPPQNCSIEIVSPLTGEVLTTATIQAGQRYRINGPERGGLGAYIIRGSR